MNYESIGKSHPFQDLFQMLRHPFLFANRIVKDSWINVSNWMIFKALFIYVFILTLRELSYIPRQISALGQGLSGVTELLNTALQSGGNMIQAAPSLDIGFVAFILWIAVTVKSLIVVFFPLTALLSIVVFSALVYLASRLWTTNSGLSFQRILVLSAYAHWALVVTFFIQSPALVFVLELIILFYLADTIKKALLSLNLPEKLPSIFGIWGTLLLMSSVLGILRLSLA